MKVTVHIIESERGWGQKVESVRVFKSLKAAHAYVTRFNKVNSAKAVPDWYMYAKVADIDGTPVST